MQRGCRAEVGVAAVPQSRAAPPQYLPFALSESTVSSLDGCHHQSWSMCCDTLRPASSPLHFSDLWVAMEGSITVPGGVGHPCSPQGRGLQGCGDLNVSTSEAVEGRCHGAGPLGQAP